MRLIDADALIFALETQDYSGSPESLEGWTPQDLTKAEIVDINKAPTIEAELVKHGKWIPLYPHEVAITNEYKCSVCGLGFDEDEETECVVYYSWKYCPHCGALMEIEE